MADTSDTVYEGDVLRSAERVAQIIESDPGVEHTLASLARDVCMSPSRLRREFERAYGVSPHKYQRAVRLGLLRDELQAGAPVARAGYSAGFGSSRGVYEHGSAVLGMAPSAYRAGGSGNTVHWACGTTRFGEVVVGATGRGVCCVLFTDGADAQELLRAEFPRADLVCDVDALGHLSGVVAVVDGRGPGADVPLHLLGTPFQRQVWAELQRIPPGQTASYTEVAARIGRPRAVRAVASACADNHAAVVVPCHRVVRSDGGLGGYKWGEGRKRALLAEEKRRDGAS